MEMPASKAERFLLLPLGEDRGESRLQLINLIR
jgi:hypothetical protein